MSQIQLDQLQSDVQYLKALVQSIPSHTPEDKSPEQIKALESKIAELTAAVKSLQKDAVNYPSKFMTGSDTQAMIHKFLPIFAEEMCKHVVKERREIEGDIKSTLGAINSDVAAVKNIGNAHIEKAADFLTSKATFLARGI
jgi:hypothetical protein